jgi:hypothetical protein
LIFLSGISVSSLEFKLPEKKGEGNIKQDSLCSVSASLSQLLPLGFYGIKKN